jgi:hypothetical protein
MSATTRPDKAGPRPRSRSGRDYSALFLVAILTLATGIAATLLDAGLVVQVPAIMLMLAGCVALSAFIVLQTAKRE